MADTRHVYDAIVVGAGFGGIASLHALRERGLDARIIEAGHGVGGVWYWNRYPGARVDTESFDYSYSFAPEIEQEWCWTERYAGHAELRAYFEYVVERLGLLPHIELGT